MEKTNLSEFPAGTLLINENEISKRMFIIQKGKARVFKNYMGKKITLAVLGEGEIFGELSFFDGEPRSASVEAMTDLKALCLDGAMAAKQVAALPEWVVPVLRKVFYRFREMDKQLVVLRSMSEYQRKVFKTDRISQTIYTELMRFIRAFELMFKEDADGEGWVEEARLYREMDEVLGQRFIGLREFWRVLREHGLIEGRGAGAGESIRPNRFHLGEMKVYLSREVTSDRFLLLGYPALAVLRRIVGYAAEQSGAISDPDLKLGDIMQGDLGLQELEKTQILKHSSQHNVVEFDSATVREHYTMQSIIKSFDHASVNVE